MGLNNEAYIVNTGTAGEVIVPIRESIQYLNVKFLGWQFYNYHEVMSQNIANLADDIQTLKDGGGASLAFNLEEILAETQATIDGKLDDINNTVISKVTSLTEALIYEEGLRISALETTINGDNTNDGLIALLAAQSLLLGDSSSGLIKEVNALKLTVGSPGEGLVGKVDINTNNINTVMGVMGNSTVGLVKQVNETETRSIDNTTNIDDLTNLIGDVNSGLVKQLNTNTTTINKLLPIIGDSTTGLVKDVEILKTTMNRVELDTDFAGLSQIVGDISKGLVKSSIDAAADISNIKLTIGDENSGIIGDIKILNSYNPAQMKTDIYGTTNITGLMNIVGDTTKGLVKEVQDLKTGIASSIPASAADMDVISDNVATLTTNLSTTNTNLTTTNTNLITVTDDVKIIKDQINLPITGIISKLTNMPSTIKDSLLTYTSGATTKVFDQATLYSMYLNSKDLTDKNIINQFRNYFYDSVAGAYISNVKIGKLAVDAWVTDTSSVGYTYLTNELIKVQITTNPTLDQIVKNKDAIALLNASGSTTGSVSNKIGVLDHLLNSTDPLDMGTITIINSNSTVLGSTDNKIKLNNDYLLSSTGPLGSVITTATTLTTNLEATNLKLDGTIEELQVEMVRYSTILPFLQQMFKLVNKVDNVTDTEIDLIFSTIADKLNALTTSNVDYKLSYNSTTNLFNIKITLDKDYKFTTVLPNNIESGHLRLTDATGSYTGTVTLAGDKLLSGIVDIFIDGTVYNNLGIVSILTDTQALASKLQFRIINSFGTEQLITVPVS